MVKTSTILSWLLLVMIVVLLLGTIGFRQIFGLSWIDSFHNTTMYASGLGPLFEARTKEAKLFSSIYALIGGLTFVAVAAGLIQRILDIELLNDDDETLL